MSHALSISQFIISQQIAEQSTLLLILSEDGSISRLGPILDPASYNVFRIGKVSKDVFLQLRGRVTPDFLKWVGQYGDRFPVGHLCRLTIAFHLAGGKELISFWQYGSESLGPPTEICDFVGAAIEASNPWYKEGKREDAAAEIRGVK